MTDDDSTKGLPLTGIRVLELGSSVAAPYGAWIMGALGAEVIKVERPGPGDDARHWGPPFAHGTSTLFHTYNREKRSLVVDLKDAAEVEKLQTFIVENIDAVIQNLRPGVADRLGLGADKLLALSPRLVYCNIWAFGASGPMQSRPGYDPLMQAFGGIMSVNGAKGSTPARVGTSIVDKGTGMWCAIGILSMLQKRQHSGRGGIVDTSLLETARAWMSFHVTDFFATGVAPEAHGSGIRGIAPYQAYRCSDGYLVVAAANDRLFSKLAETLGHPEWLKDERFENNPARSRNLSALNAQLDPEFARATRAEWEMRLGKAGIPCAPMQTLDEVVVHPQVQSLGIVQTSEPHEIPMVGPPVKFDGERPPLRREAPELGEYNETFSKS